MITKERMTRHGAFIIICILLNVFICSAQVHKTSAAKKSKPSTHITVSLADSLNGDTLRLYVYGKFISAVRTLPVEKDEKKAVIKKGMAEFDLPEINKPTYITLFSSDKLRDTLFGKYIPVLYQYFIEPGDHVSLKVEWDSTYHADKHRVNWEGHGWTPLIVFNAYTKYILQYKYLFSGNGSAKYKVRADLDKMENPLFDLPVWDKNGGLQPSRKVQRGIELIDTYQANISPLAFGILKADLTGEIEQYRLRVPLDPNTSAEKKLVALKVPINAFPTEIMTLSRYYADFLADYYKLKYPVDAKVAGTGAYYHLKDDYTGELRDRLLTNYLLMKHSFLLPEVIEDAVHAIKTPFYFNEVSKLYDAFRKGRPAFDFSLPDAKGNSLQLSGLKGKVVFMDFWYTGCENCGPYYHNVISKAEEKFRDNPNVVFLSISIDNDWKKWLKSVNSGEYTSATAKNVINLFTDGKGIHHPLIEKYRVFGYPCPLLIDREGKIFDTSDTNLRYNGESGLIQTIQSALDQP